MATLEKFNEGNPVDINNLNNLVDAVKSTEILANQSIQTIKNTTTESAANAAFIKTITVVQGEKKTGILTTVNDGKTWVESAPIPFPAPFTGDTPVVVVSLAQGLAKGEYVNLLVKDITVNQFVVAAQSNTAKSITINYIASSKRTT